MNNQALLDLCESELTEREADVSPMYYPIDSYVGELFCEDCIETDHPDWKYGEDYSSDVWTEEDGSRVCEKCGRLLAYVLTNYGVDSELDHFLDPESAPWDWNDPNDCFEVARIVYGAYGDEQMALVAKLLRKGKNPPDEIAKALKPRGRLKEQ